MVKLYSIALLGLAASSSVIAAPFTKRVAQTISASTAKWEQACRAAGGGQQCNPISVTAFSTLLANAGPCDQQDSADAMVDIGKQLNSQDVITLAQIFAQQPRNSPNSVSIPYCQKAPKNAELNGLFQCQFAGVNPATFVGGVSVGGAGTVPFGQTAPLNPAGSCPAHPQGPVPDGQQLVDIVQSPGTPAGNGGGAAPPAQATPTPAPTNGNDNAEGDDGFDDCDDDDDTPIVVTATATVTQAPPTQTPSPADIALQNGLAAQKLNNDFNTILAPGQSCDGTLACIKGQLANCVNGKFEVASCGTDIICAALPRVGAPGTSIACLSLKDAEDRIAATGAKGGLTGNSGNSSSTTVAPPAATPTAPESSVPAAPPAATTIAAPPADPTMGGGANTGGDSGNFVLQNGKDAQALNAQFAGLTPDSACTAGQNACVSGGFAQCVNGKFVVTQCAGGLVCAALPLVNKPGTSLACTTQADALDRIQRTGATGGISG